MSVFKKLWNSNEKLKDSENVVDEIKEYQPYNPFTELLFLDQHKDIVRLLVKIDSRRCVSAADDNLAIVWDIQFGYKLATLSGHSRPITAILYLPAKGNHFQQLVTGSSDKQIRVWNPETGDCLKVITEHQSSVKCFLAFGKNGQFCSGGKRLCLWSRQGELLASFNSQEQEMSSSFQIKTDHIFFIDDIIMMIQLQNDRIVVAVDKCLAVFTVFCHQNYQNVSVKHSSDVESISVKHSSDIEVVSVDQVVCLPLHREPIRSLINIGDNFFASASLDGTINIWQTDSLLCCRYFNLIEQDFEGQNKTYPYSVEQMICIGQRYIVAAIGVGFSVFDSKTGEQFQKQNAHHSKINCLTFICEGLYFATASVDGSIRLWSFVEVLKDTIQGTGMFANIRESGLLHLWYTGHHHNFKVSLVGESTAHSGSVQALVDCDGESLISCGLDGLVIVWKNENVQRMKRNNVLHMLKRCDGIV